MTKTDNRHYNTSEKRMLKIQADYWGWYYGQETKYGIVSDVVYVGNTVYGNVKVFINGCWYLVWKPVACYKPRKTDIANLVITSAPQ